MAFCLELGSGGYLGQRFARLQGHAWRKGFSRAAKWRAMISHLRTHRLTTAWRATRRKTRASQARHYAAKRTKTEHR